MIDYYAKYNKYKKKYNDLKKTQKGGMVGDIIDVQKLYVELGKTNNKVGDKTKEIFESSGNSSTYGELTKEGMDKMLDGIVTKGKTFIDMGSGLGKTVIWAAIKGFQKSIGIELAKERHDAATSIQNSLSDIYKNNITFINDSFFDAPVDFSSIDIVWISSLCFPNEIMGKIANKLNNDLKKGAIVFSSKEINAPKLVPSGTMGVKMTWNENSNVHKYIVS